MPARTVRRSVVAAALALGVGATGALIGLGAAPAAASPAAAAPRCGYSISGNVSPSTAFAGDTMTASLTISAASRCYPVDVGVYGSGGVFNSKLGDCHVTSGSCVVRFRAVMGLSRVDARIAGQATVWNQSVTVLDPPVTTVRVTTPAPPPTSRPPAGFPSRTSTATAARSATSTRTASKRPQPYVKRTYPALKEPDSPWETGSFESGDAPAPTDTGASVVAVGAEVTKGSGGANPIPLGLVLVSLAVIAGLLVAVVRMVAAHTRVHVGP